MASRVKSAVNDSELKEFKGEVERLFRENDALKESLSDAMSMLAHEDRDWAVFNGGGEMVDGFEVIELHQWARQLREAVAGNSHMKQGLQLRTSYVWSRLPRYKNIKGKKQGRGVNVQERIDNPRNQRNFFSAQAREKRESALYTDSAYYVLADYRDFTLQPIPIWEIQGHFANPDDQGEVWAFLRVWNHYTPGLGYMPKRMWYFTDLFPNYAKDDPERPTSINISGVSDPVDPNIILFEDHVNGQIGWPYGVPDSLPALAWARLYRDFLTNGKIMSDAMARIAFRATARTQQGASNVTAKLVQRGDAGQTVVTGAADGFQAISTAGRGYDFSSGDGLAAVIAAALEVPLVHLTADSSKGGSYGATATLDLPTQLAVRRRQNWHTAFDKRILTWLGAPDAEVTFMSLESSADVFREVQALLLAWGSGLYAGEPIEARISELMDIVGNIIPDGVIIPNNSDASFMVSPDRTAVPKGGEPPIAGQGGQGGQQNQGNPNATSPGQGQGTGVGKGIKPNDLRTDKIAQAAAQLGLIVQEIEAEYGGSIAA